MRLLFTSKTGSLGHLLPLFPIAEAARASGEEVTVATSVDRQHDVEAIGCEFVAAGLELSQVRGRIDLVRQRLIESGRPPPPRWGSDLEHTYAEMFTTVHAPVMADDLTHIVETFRPDVLVCDVGEFGGPVAAAVAGIPCASHGFGQPIPEWLAREAGHWAAPMWTERGLSAPDDAGMYSDLHFSNCPPLLDPGDGWPGATVQLVAPPQRESHPPAWMATLPERPTVYVTLGTAAGREAGLLDVALSGLIGLDVNVVVTVGRDGDPTKLKAAGSNVTVHSFIPQNDLLPLCSLVVCHGGSGTMLGALAHGVPVVALPHMADHFRNADALHRAGCGIALPEADQTRPAIEAAVRSALRDSSLLAAAATVRGEIATMPGPAAAVDQLRQLVIARSGGSYLIG